MLTKCLLTVACCNVWLIYPHRSNPMRGQNLILDTLNGCVTKCDKTEVKVIGFAWSYSLIQISSYLQVQFNHVACSEVFSFPPGVLEFLRSPFSACSCSYDILDFSSDSRLTFLSFHPSFFLECLRTLLCFYSSLPGWSPSPFHSWFHRILTHGFPNLGSWPHVESLDVRVFGLAHDNNRADSGTF